jgi:hypothetical protein
LLRVRHDTFGKRRIMFAVDDIDDTLPDQHPRRRLIEFHSQLSILNYLRASSSPTRTDRLTLAAHQTKLTRCSSGRAVLMW